MKLATVIRHVSTGHCRTVRPAGSDVKGQGRDRTI